MAQEFIQTGYQTEPDPTPEEISMATELIRAEWSPREERKRRVGKPGRYTIPEAPTPEDSLDREWNPFL